MRCACALGPALTLSQFDLVKTPASRSLRLREGRSTPELNRNSALQGGEPDACFAEHVTTADAGGRMDSTWTASAGSDDPLLLWDVANGRLPTSAFPCRISDRGRLLRDGLWRRLGLAGACEIAQMEACPTAVPHDPFRRPAALRRTIGLATFQAFRRESVSPETRAHRLECSATRLRMLIAAGHSRPVSP